MAPAWQPKYKASEKMVGRLMAAIGVESTYKACRGRIKKESEDWDKDNATD